MKYLPLTVTLYFPFPRPFDRIGSRSSLRVTLSRVTSGRSMSSSSSRRFGRKLSLSEVGLSSLVAFESPATNNNNHGEEEWGKTITIEQETCCVTLFSHPWPETVGVWVGRTFYVRVACLASCLHCCCCCCSNMVLQKIPPIITLLQHQQVRMWLCVWTLNLQGRWWEWRGRDCRCCLRRRLCERHEDWLSSLEESKGWILSVFLKETIQCLAKMALTTKIIEGGDWVK